MNGAESIAAERQRQIDVEGYDQDHDAGHASELALAAACYALPPDSRRLTGDVGLGIDVTVELVAAIWPWEERFWKPTADRIRELEKAGALMAAAIDALRAEDPDPTGAEDTLRMVGHLPEEGGEA
jgi:hypothetical protein